MWSLGESNECHVTRATRGEQDVFPVAVPWQQKGRYPDPGYLLGELV